MRFRDLHPNIKIRFLQSFVNDMLGNMIHPFMTIYFADRFGLTWAGILLAANVVIGMIAGFYGGPLADRIGRKKVLLYAEYLRCLAFAVMALANSPWYDSPSLTFAMTALISVFWGISGPAGDAMLIDCSTEENRPLVYSFGYWSWNLTVLIGGFVGGFLFKTHLFEIFVAAAVASLSSVALLVWFIEETYVPPIAQGTAVQRNFNPFASLAAYRNVWKDRVFMLYIAASLLLYSLETMVLQYSGVRLEAELQPQQLFALGQFTVDIDGIKMFGILSAENALIVIGLGLLVPHVIRRFAERHVLAAGILISAIGYCTITVTNLPWLLIGMMVVATVGEITWVPVNQTLLARVVPVESRSTYLAVHGLTHQLSNLLGSIAVTLGAFLTSWSMSGLFLLTVLVSLLLYLRVMVRLRDRAALQPAATMEQPV